MSKVVKLASLMVVSVSVFGIALFGASQVFAQGQSLPNGVALWQMQGGFPGHGPGMGGMMDIDEEAMHAQIAEILGISEAEFEAALTEGKTPYTLAEELGVDFSEIQAAMQAAHAQAIGQAVADGTISPEQAARMLERMNNSDMYANGEHFGSPMTGNAGDCH